MEIAWFGFQYEEICKIAGPLSPLCVSKMFSLNSESLQFTWASTEMPLSCFKASSFCGAKVKGTSAARVG